MSADSPAFFDLAFERTDYNLLAIVRHSLAGTGIASINIPIHEQEVRYFWQQALDEFQSSDSVLEAQYLRAQDIGDRLFRFVFAQPVRQLFYDSINLAYQRQLRMQLRLIFSGVPELANLPWEYLYDASRQEFLSLSLQTPMFRHRDLLHQIRPVGITLPFRVLVVISSPSNMPRIDVEREWLALIDTFDHLALDGKMVIERLREPTPFGLQRQLRKKEYHALHFVGFGEYDELSQDGMLVFEDQTGRARTVSGQHVGSILRDHNTMRLATLNLRLPPRKTPDERPALISPFVVAANSIVQRGVPAVITLSQEVPPFALLTFYDEVYSSVSNFTTIDVAVARGRQMVLAEQQSAAFGVPICLTRTVDGTLYYDAAQGPPQPPRPSQSELEIHNLRLKYWQ